MATRTLQDAERELDEEFGAPDRAMVPARPESGLEKSVSDLAAEDAAQNGTGRIVFCTFDLDSRAGKIRAFNSIGGNAVSLSDNLNTDIQLRNVIAHTVELTNEATGEISNHVRTVIEDADGTFYAAVSEGVINSLRKLFGIFGFPPYDPPLVIRARTVKTRKSFSVIVLEVVGDAPDTSS